MSDHAPWPLIAKYLAGECTPEETTTINAWLENIDNRLLFDEIKSGWEQQLMPSSEEPDIEKGLSRLHEKIAGLHEDKVTELPASSIRSINSASWMIAAGLALLIGFGYLFLKDGQNKKNDVAQVQITSGNNEVVSLYLPDSSRVWLNKKSTIRYPKQFADNQRVVQMEGEAFFEVVKNPSKPFIVKCNELSTRVLGTSFNVKAYPFEKEASVTVATGLVEVSNAEKEGETVSKSNVIPLQKLVLDKESKDTYISSVRTADIANWIQEPLIFRDNTYAEVVAALKERFLVTITMEGNNLKQCRVMANFNRGASLEDILKLLSMSNSFKYSVTGDHVRISGGVCN